MAKSRYVYSDIDPLLNESLSGDIDVSFDANAVFQSIRNIMATVSGERVRNPIGSRLLGFLFEPISEEVAEDISEEIHRVVSMYEPRITNLRVRATPDVDSLTYHVKMSFSVMGLDGSEVMQVPLRVFV